MQEPKKEYHPFPPFLPPDAKILMLGSFPPKSIRWSMDFYYPNMQNDMWRIMGLIFFGDKNHFITGKKFDEAGIRQFCAAKKIALGDTAESVVRIKDNASDKFLEIIDKIDLEAILRRIPRCTSIVTTGQKATDTLLSIISASEPRVGSFTEFTFAGRMMRLYRMPSSSRAYPKPLEEKAAVYRIMLDEAGIL